MELFWFSGVFTVLLAFAALLFLGWFIFMSIDYYLFNSPPGPVGLPIVGYAPFLSKYYYKDLARLNQIYGNLCSLTILTTRHVFVSDYETAKELLCHPATYARPEGYFDSLPGKAGFSTMEGKQWVQERRLAIQVLHHSGVGKGPWIDNLREETGNVIDSIASSQGEPIRICEMLSQSAYRCMLTFIFGHQYVINMTEDDFQLLFEGKTVSSEEIQKSAFISVFPSLRKFLLTFNVAGFKSRKKILDEISKRFRKEIEKRLKFSDLQDGTDFTTQYITELKRKTLSEPVKDSSVDCLLGNIVTFMGTSETGILGTKWLLYLMAANSEIQAKVHNEIDTVIGRNSSVAWNDREKLPYLFACIMEMHRWVSIVPIFTPRRSTATFQFHGYTIRRGTVILCNPWAFHRDPKYWDDPDKYIPERFLTKKPEKLEKIEGYAPFSFGRRNCPADRISLKMVFHYFSGIMQKFEIRTPSGGPIDFSPLYGIVLEPKDQDLCFIKRE